MNATVNTNQMSGTPSIYFDRVASTTLESNLAAYEGADHKDIPDNSGSVIQLHGYENFAFSSTPASEGTVGTGLTPQDVVNQLTLSEFSDFITWSRKIKVTGLADAISEGAARLGYRAARIVDRIILTALDNEAATDSATVIEPGAGVYLSAELSRQARASLEAVDARPKADGNMYGITHPLNAFDLTNDPSAGGWVDIQRYANAQKLISGTGSGYDVGVIGGVRWKESSVVPTSSTFYYSYVLGAEAVYCASLGKTPSGGKNFSVYVNMNYAPGSQVVDPTGTIAASAGYWYLFGAQTRPNITNTFRRLKLEASIS